MKKDYLSPELKTVEIGDLMQGPVIPIGSPTDEFGAKEQQNDVTEEETLPINKNIWEDDEE
jgi:hypothetical protein